LAQAPWPNKPVHFIVPFPPGQAADIFARLMAEKLTDVWKQQVVVENKAGGSGIPATEYGKAAAPDGYTLMIVSSGTFGVNPSLYPTCRTGRWSTSCRSSNIFLVPLVIVAHPSFPANTLAELIELARKEPGQLSYASAGPGTSQHLSMELFKMRAKLDIVHIPYKGSGPAMADLLGGHVKLMMDSTAAALSAITDKRIKALALTTARRAAPPLDFIPPIADTLPGFDAAGWSGLAAPARTPLEIVAKVNRDVNALLQDSAVGPRDRTPRRPACARLTHPVRRVHQERDRHLGRGRARDRDEAGDLTSCRTAGPPGPLMIMMRAWRPRGPARLQSDRPQAVDQRDHQQADERRLRDEQHHRRDADAGERQQRGLDAERCNGGDDQERGDVGHCGLHVGRHDAHRVERGQREEAEQEDRR
jgi:tripartite-type tricarboxylate transporter receptor subunit TctC